MDEVVRLMIEDERQGRVIERPHAARPIVSIASARRQEKAAP
jgi:hypothetical protein